MEPSRDLNAGPKPALTSLLTNPQFLFRIETLEVDPGNPGAGLGELGVGSMKTPKTVCEVVA